MGILPDDEGFVQGVEAVAASVEGGERERLLLAFCVCEVQGQGVRDPAFFLEGADDAVDESGRLGFVAVGDDYVDVAGVGAPATVAADDDAFDSAFVGCKDTAVRVRLYDRGDGFGFGAWDSQLEFVVVLRPICWTRLRDPHPCSTMSSRSRHSLS